MIPISDGILGVDLPWRSAEIAQVLLELNGCT
jgi:hypothetical protein